MLAVVLMAFTIFMALLTVELKNLLYASLCFCGACISIAALFWLLEAPYVSALQLFIYAGAVVVLFIATIMLTKREEQSQE